MGDNVIKRGVSRISDFHREFDVDTADRFRSYRGKYPREGYVPGETNPFSEPKDTKKPPPFRD